MSAGGSTTPSAGPSSRMTSPVASTYDGGHSRSQSVSTQPAPSLPASVSSSSHMQSQANAPTLISYGNKSVRARVDREVPIDEIIRSARISHSFTLYPELLRTRLQSTMCVSATVYSGTSSTVLPAGCEQQRLAYAREHPEEAGDGCQSETGGLASHRGCRHDRKAARSGYEKGQAGYVCAANFCQSQCLLFRCESSVSY